MEASSSLLYNIDLGLMSEMFGVLTCTHSNKTIILYSILNSITLL